jgi:hypothetical protein
MSINPNTEITHPELGPIRFDDGKPNPVIAGSRETAPMWVCRPEGWNSNGFEIYLPGTPSSPQNLERAVLAVRHREQIEAEGRRLSNSNVRLAWIDMMTDPPSVAFPDEDHVYVIWKGWLDDRLQVRELKQANW